ncbi:Hypothetical predicted protein [Octopus vulgaris]|uniref:Uncharacterized protein n=1 Tax=Octopus vulgaris TaxID=6645 RepID=A0AA36B8I0_OCTVU|nr:Hypothetical predicted protein [Octopus vulgaris]
MKNMKKLKKQKAVCKGGEWSYLSEKMVRFMFFKSITVVVVLVVALAVDVVCTNRTFIVKPKCDPFTSCNGGGGGGGGGGDSVMMEVVKTVMRKRLKS